jgi:hypothetical protein
VSSENTTTVDRIYDAFETRDLLTFFNFLSPAIHITEDSKNCSEEMLGLNLPT